MDITIREATQDDVVEIATVHVAGWQEAYGGLLDQSYIDAHGLEKRTVDWAEWLQRETGLRYVALDGSRIIGFCTFGSLETPPPGTSKIRPLYSSEIYGLYLLPDYHRQGIGKKIFQFAVQKLKEKKHQSLCLWVLEGNKRARSFYEAMGGQRIGKKMVEFGPSKAKEICYGWRDINKVFQK